MKILTSKDVIFRIVMIISMAELLIMLFLAALPVEVNRYAAAVIDIILLVVLSTPLIFLWVIQPFVTSRDEALARISHLAHTDSLTNLPNRRMLNVHFDQLVARSIRHKVYSAVLLMDLDGFKVLNDKHGHEAGDKVLVEISNRIRSIIRTEDVAARFGGDEFIILISQLDTNEQGASTIAVGIAEKLIRLVDQPIVFEGAILKVGASIGIRLLGQEEIDAETAIREADTAMYHAKSGGRGKAVIFGE